MRITGFESNDTLLAEIGQRVRDIRIATPLTRDELARKAGVSAQTIANLERGRGATLENAINILRGLNLASNLELLVPEQGPRPLDLAKLGKKRQRATSPKAQSRQQKGSAWGDSTNVTWEVLDSFNEGALQ